MGGLDAMAVGAQRWLLRRADAVAGARQGRPEHLRVGERGELEAMFALRALGMTVVARRWTTGRLRGDLDLVAWEGDVLCFVEVKTRSRRDVMDPAEAAVDGEKRRVLRRMATAYLRGFPEVARRAVVSRFDVMAVYLGDADGVAGEPVCELLREAFGWRE